MKSRTNAASIQSGKRPPASKSEKEDTGSKDKCTTDFNDQDLLSEFKIDGETLASYRETFDLFDLDGNGRITLDEISTLISSLGYSVSRQHVKNMLGLVDIDGNGVLDFKEFLQLLSAGRSQSSTSKEQELKYIFEVFDKNSDGFIDENELSSVLLRLGINLTSQEIKDMINEADFTGKGKVCFEGFKRILHARN
ncbi:hypothetical protein GJ496_006815 [Pomphorhynchus laevis]|nr:hypothetical protein GJ496_006815 [Pomphorhynchus laevis]